MSSLPRRDIEPLMNKGHQKVEHGVPVPAQTVL
jgi:hypothetical protein